MFLFFWKSVPFDNIVQLIWLLWPLCQLSVHWSFVPLPSIAVISVYPFLPLARMNQRKCWACFPFFFQEGRFLSLRNLSSDCRAKAETVDAATAVLILSSDMHHLLQSGYNVQMHLISPGSIKRAFNGCTFIEHSRVKFHLFRRAISGKNKASEQTLVN